MSKRIKNKTVVTVHTFLLCAAALDFAVERLIIFLPVIYSSGYQRLECLFEEVLTDLIGLSHSELLKGV